ncbi:hypothetical protein PR001_g6627 [Phytophthora rubi]|uniref:Uncharacterized protein n=1 Tax=Phytophthora rubi TaxID=129364 RepID=A0A6A3N7R1_9STRA|nr:hypothetical protein PR001_g6627 [Phytophthora rubi]
MPPPPSPRLRTAQKRPLLPDDLDDSPLLPDDLDDSGSDASCSSSSGWQPSTGPSQAESTETTNSASEVTTQGHVIAPPPRKTQFKSWEAFDAYLATKRNLSRYV